MRFDTLDRKGLEELYRSRLQEDFPPSELRPLSGMKYLMEKDAYRCLVSRENGKVSAYAFLAYRENAALLDYFAVDPSLRGQGYGSRFLSGLREYGLEVPWLLIEVESLESSENSGQRLERERRIRFYKHCGCRATNVYSLLFGVEYQILILPLKETETPDDGEVLSTLESLYRMIVPPVIEGRNVTFAQVCRCFLRPAVPRDFTRELGRAVTFLQRSRRKFMGERLKEYGFSGAMYTILLHVDRHPGVTQDGIANHLYIDKCNVARRTKKLEELGYLCRETDESDRRQNNLYLTDRGRELVPVIRDCLSLWGEETAARLDPSERATLILLLSKMTGQNET